jgi:hypothetical protein
MDKYQKAWEKFRAKMDSLKKMRLELLKKISQKTDEQKIKALKEKLK